LTHDADRLGEVGVVADARESVGVGVGADGRESVGVGVGAEGFDEEVRSLGSGPSPSPRPVTPGLIQIP
jgi:hypothetical protein